MAKLLCVNFIYFADCNTFISSILFRQFRSFWNFDGIYVTPLNYSISTSFLYWSVTIKKGLHFCFKTCMLWTKKEKLLSCLESKLITFLNGIFLKGLIFFLIISMLTISYRCRICMTAACLLSHRNVTWKEEMLNGFRRQNQVPLHNCTMIPFR